MLEEPTLAEVKSAIKKLNSHKACGTDGIPGELIKFGGEELCNELWKLVIKIWRLEEIPSEWKKGIIIPVFKKGDKQDCLNYRGISLLITTYKVFTRILYNRVLPYAENTIGEYQSGFRAGRSTSDHIFTLRMAMENFGNIINLNTIYLLTSNEPMTLFTDHQYMTS